MEWVGAADSSDPSLRQMVWPPARQMAPVGIRAETMAPLVL